MKLVIVESPTKAKTLAGILGKDFEIKASMGHIRDLPKKGLGVDVDKNFEPAYEVPEKSKKVLAELKKSAKDSNEIILATDPDREGEAIAWHLSSLLASKKVKFERVVFHELTKSAIEEAFTHPGTLDINLVDAQQARRILDRLVGYKLSPLLWKKVRYGLSAGRVQSVAVRLIVERERERQQFKPEEYWSIYGDFENDAKKQLKAELVEKNSKKLEIISGDQAKKLENELKIDSFKISEIKKTERQRKPYAPFKTSTLQQSASNVFGFTAKRTMSSAQKLFEHGYITYHRTDSLNLSPQFVNVARDYIAKEMKAEYLPEKGVFYKTNAKNAQEAHEAIRPTNLFLEPAHLSKKLSADDVKIYSLIWKRSLECQMLPAVYDQTTITIGSTGGYLFRATGSIIKFDGWLYVGKHMAIEEDPETLNELPDFVENEAVTLNKLTSEQHFTQPPARYSDATLIKALEELEIGRPSTYAPTITTIQSRGYVVKESKYFVPTDVAYVVTDLLVEHFPDVIDYKFTAQVENSLDAIANGEKKWVPVIREFYTPFEKEVKEKDKVLQKHDITNLGESGEKCPECGKVLIYKLGKYGKFLSCSGYPDCAYARPIEETKNGEEVPQDYGKCPNCETGVFVLRQGKFGKFLACSNYPKCKTTQKYLEKIDMKCPKCADGDVIIKKAKGRTFYGCSRYPQCDYSSWKNPLKPDAAQKEEISQIA